MAVRHALCCAAWLSACAPAKAPATLAGGELLGSDGRVHPLVDPRARLTVLEFFSGHCKCQAAHDARWRELVLGYSGRGVSFLAIDSEAGADLARDRHEAKGRGYVHPILLDPDGAYARLLGARYATYTVVVDPRGAVVYAGGLDSDLTRLSSDATPYLRDALDDALAGRAVRRPSAQALGCALGLE